jgi:hypothetical protein
MARLTERGVKLAPLSAFFCSNSSIMAKARADTRRKLVAAACTGRSVSPSAKLFFDVSSRIMGDLAT